MSNPNNYAIEIRRRPWWHWLIAALWLLLVLFLLNVGIASAAELEPQASLYGYVSALIVFLIGVAAYGFEKNRAAKA